MRVHTCIHTAVLSSPYRGTGGHYCRGGGTRYGTGQGQDTQRKVWASRGANSPFRSSTRGLLGRLSEKLVLAANLPPSTTSWDTTLRPLASRRSAEKAGVGWGELAALSALITSLQSPSQLLVYTTSCLQSPRWEGKARQDKSSQDRAVPQSMLRVDRTGPLFLMEGEAGARCSYSGRF